MQDGIHNEFQPKDRSVCLCVLVAVTVLGGIGGQAMLAQERRSGPKVIMVPDLQRPSLSLRLVPPPAQKEPPLSPGGSARERSSEAMLKSADVQPRKAPASVSVGRSEPRSALTPPRFKSMRLPTAEGQPPDLDEQQSVNSAGKTVFSTVNPLREASVTGRTNDARADCDKSDSAPSAVSPAIFATTERTVAVAGESPRSDAESAVPPPLTDKIAEPNAPVWRIVGEWVAISFSIALSLLACSLVLLAMRQLTGGKHGSILRVEFAHAEGGSFVLPFSLAPQTEKADERGRPPRCHTQVADFTEAPLAAAMLGSLFGESRGRGETQHGEQEKAILQQILEDNIALQKGV